jgi:hypothetical protein|tara:strand:- start:317 stop:487 length:171 start_codon:yes stop_codon:yes gene_type:complete
MDKLLKAKVTKTYHTTEGTLYMDSIVRVESSHNSLSKVRDELGKIYYINSTDLVSV